MQNLAAWLPTGKFEIIRYHQSCFVMIYCIDMYFVINLLRNEVVIVFKTDIGFFDCCYLLQKENFLLYYTPHQKLNSYRITSLSICLYVSQNPFYQDQVSINMKINKSAIKSSSEINKLRLNIYLNSSWSSGISRRRY